MVGILATKYGLYPAHVPKNNTFRENKKGGRPAPAISFNQVYAGIRLPAQ